MKFRAGDIVYNNYKLLLSKKQNVVFKPLKCRTRPIFVENNSLDYAHAPQNNSSLINGIAKTDLKKIQDPDSNQIKSYTPKQSDVDKIFSQALRAAGGKKLDRKVIKRPIFWPELKKNKKSSQAGPVAHYTSVRQLDIVTQKEIQQSQLADKQLDQRKFLTDQLQNKYNDQTLLKNETETNEN